jgi:long-chain acyl-CoA synthetase
MNAPTIVRLFHEILSVYDRSDHLHYRSDGRWNSISTGEFGETVKLLAAGLITIGVRAGAKVGIVSNPSPWWVMTDFAIQLAGGVTVPVFRRISPENLRFEIDDSAMEAVFIGDEAEFDSVRRSGERLRKIVTIGFTRDDSLSLSFEGLVETGRKALQADPELAGHFADPAPEDIATLIYTSGSTGVPKGVMLTHSSLMFQVASASVRFPMDSAKDVALTSLPLSHVFERMVMYYYLSSGVSVWFVDDLAKIGEMIREVRPTIMTAVPRLLEKVEAKMGEASREGSALKRLIAGAAMKRAVRKDPDRFGPNLLDPLFDLLVYRKLRAALGGRFRYVISGAASLSRETGRFFVNIGLPLFEGYGMTEASPVIAANFPGSRKLGTVGLPFPGVDVKIGEEDELLARGPGVMRGYWNNPAETAKALDSDGFLHTGDQAKIDARGFITITGRKKELMKKSTGEYVPPVPIEQKIGRNPLVEYAVVVAENRRFVSCLIFPDMEEVEKLRRETPGAPADAEAFAAGPEVRKNLADHIAEVNRHLHHTEEVQKFRVIVEPVSVETGEITPTMKVRRHMIEERFAREIEELYRE